jgi:long-chain acyl-CoA synthetase
MGGVSGGLVADERRRTPLGEEDAAAVVVRPGSLVTACELRRWVANLLAPYKVPRRIWIVEALPRTTTGKMQRRELSRRLSELGRAAGA